MSGSVGFSILLLLIPAFGIVRALGRIASALEAAQPRKAPNAEP